MAIKVGGTTVINDSRMLENISGIDLTSGNTKSHIVTVSGTDINCNLGNYFTKTVSANTTFTFSNAPLNRAYGFVLEVVHTGGAITWPGSVKWSYNFAPVLSTGSTHLFVFVTDDSGLTWKGSSNVEYAG